ncbi:MAG: PEGA domain-containing protein [Paludibacter sp.]
MKKLLTSVLFYLLFTSIFAQQISVKSFRRLDNDMDARVNEPLKDPNGDICAIIKVVTTQKGFNDFDCGQIGVVKTVQKTAEVWVYVPYGAKRITIKHPVLGVMRDYFFPQPIEKATVYEMVITTGKVTITVDETPSTQFLIIESTPTGADVFINEQHKGRTPFQMEMAEGEYTYRVAKELYYPEVGKLKLNATDAKKPMVITLRPNFGFVQISTKPEINAEVKIDGITNSKTTPFKTDTLRSGKHKIDFSKSLYHDQSKEITVVDNQTIPLEVEMRPAFGAIVLDSKLESGATVSMDGKETGKITPCKFEQVLSGEHTLTLRKEWYEPKTIKVKVEDGLELKQTVELQSTFGNVKLITDAESELFVDNQPKGKGKWEGRLISGLHSFEARKEKHHAALQKNDIYVGDTKEINLTPQPIYGKLKIVTNAIGAAIKLNGKEYGTTPNMINDLFIGNYNLTIEKEGFGTLFKNITIEEGKTTDIKDTLTTGLQVNIQTSPLGAQLFVDNKPIGKTPMAFMLSFGNHKVRLVNGKREIEEKITIKQGGTTNFNFDVNESVSVMMNGSLKNTAINIDGKQLGEIPLRTMLNVGDHNLKLKKGTDVLEIKINISSAGKNEFSFNNRDFVKGFYKKHVLSVAYGYHQTTFANTTFADRITNGSITKEFGHAATLTTNLYPFSVNLTAFSAGFKAHNLVPFNDNATISHQGIELSMNYIPINIGTSVFPYIGAGYQISRLYSPAGSMTIEGAAVTNTSLPVIKGGVQFKFGQIFVFGEYKQTISVGGSTYNSQQLSVGIGWIF